jgi:hypothetical protein
MMRSIQVSVRDGWRLAAGIAVSAVMVAPAAVAQPRQPAPLPQAGAPAPQRVETQTMGTMEGALRKVDPAGGVVQVSYGPFGLMARTLEVTSATRIQLEGRAAGLAALREGSNVKASYEIRQGKSVATEIDVLPGDTRR